ncbi:MAG: FAD-binding oxidoreductase [Ardenticatenaceae bacterium]|nr:FAD-binding oxidoreductase [Ardenticatenaceae bacterium]
MKKYDYIVVGNGLMGSAAGRYLSEMGGSVAIIGPGEPEDHATHEGVFSSHYDQGRLVRELSQDPIWSIASRLAVQKYGMLEERSGLSFHGPVGRVLANNPSPEERRELLDWLEQASQEYGIAYQYFEKGDRSWKKLFPYLDFPEEYDLFYEPAPAGYINPRQMLRAQNVIAQQCGAEVVAERVVGVVSTADSVTVTTAEGNQYVGEKVLIACGAFTNFNNLLPQPIPLRLKTEAMIWADVDEETAVRLQTMPGVGYDIDDPDLDDIYMAPPVLYPDGKYKVKMGCNTAHESWPETLAEVQDWFRRGHSDEDKPAMAEALQSVLPEVQFGAMTTHCCIVTYTPSGYPTIDGAPGDVYGRLFIATGGNGSSAQGSDTFGWLAAGWMVDGRWPDDLPRQPFLATNKWGESKKKLTKAQERAFAKVE